MRLVTFLDEAGAERIGALADGDKTIIALQAGALAKDNTASPYFESMLAFLEGGLQAREKGAGDHRVRQEQRPPDTIVPSMR